MNAFRGEAKNVGKQAHITNHLSDAAKESRYRKNVEDLPDMYCDKTSSHYESTYKPYCDEYYNKKAAASRAREALKRSAKTATTTNALHAEGKTNREQLEFAKQFAEENPDTVCDVDYEDFKSFEPFCDKYLLRKTAKDPEKYCKTPEYKEKYEKYCQKYYELKDQEDERRDKLEGDAQAKRQAAEEAENARLARENESSQNIVTTGTEEKPKKKRTSSKRRKKAKERALEQAEEEARQEKARQDELDNLF